MRAGTHAVMLQRWVRDMAWGCLAGIANAKIWKAHMYILD